MRPRGLGMIPGFGHDRSDDDPGRSGGGAMKIGAIWGPAALVAALGAAGCERPRAAEAAKPTPPATVSKTAKEDDLGTVKLTKQAAERLGVMTATVERRPVERSRTYAGDVI